jgi:hypothetical protein
VVGKVGWWGEVGMMMMMVGVLLFLDVVWVVDVCCVGPFAA